MTVDWTKYLANGIPTTGGSVPLRKEIGELSKEEVYLFLQGLAKLQQVPMTDPLSYFQLAGIHGEPYRQAWPDEGGKKKPSFGYCEHSSVLFLPWHRPYLALFESALYKHVNDVAAGIEGADAAKYKEAAKSFRLPYWDWARRRSGSLFPEQAFSTYTVPDPPKSSATAKMDPLVSNPLSKAPFEIGVPFNITGQRQSATQRTTTRRYPGLSDGVSALNDALNSFHDVRNDKNMQPDSISRNLSERVSYLLKSYDNFVDMSFNGYRGPEGGYAGYGSLEDCHNSIHGITGGRGGHMSNPSYAAFDPIFWLHHANIDRLFAIWQVLHVKNNAPISWVPGPETTPQESKDRTTPLYPFRKAATDEKPWYASDLTKSPVNFGYTYKEIVGFKSEDASESDVRALHAKIETMYPSAAAEIRRSMRKDPKAGELLLAQTAVVNELQDPSRVASVSEMKEVISQLPDPVELLEGSLQPGKPLLRDLAPQGHYLEWLVNLKAVKHSLGGRYTVYVFLGPIEEDDVVMWPFSPNFVDSFYPFGQDENTECEKCQADRARQLQVTGQIPLTFALMERYLATNVTNVTNLTPEVVVPYLKTNLHWRVVLDEQVLQDRSQVQGLTVAVVSNKVTLPEDGSQLPIYDPHVTVYPEITTNLQNEGRGEGTGLVAGQQ